MPGAIGPGRLRLESCGSAAIHTKPTAVCPPLIRELVLIGRFCPGRRDRVGGGSMSAEFADLGTWLVPVIGGATCLVAYLVGRAFLVSKPRPPADSTDAMTSEFLQGITRERRGAPRRKGSAVEVHLLLGQGQLPIPGWVIDRSIGGLGVL